MLLAVKHDLPSVQLLLSSEIESITVEIASIKSFIVCVVYVPPIVDDIYYKHLSDLLFSLPLDGNVLILIFLISTGTFLMVGQDSHLISVI